MVELDEQIASILVIGGGISGITASLDLANQGYHVLLVEKTASIGGKMAQLDKTFPTLDCSICILAPKMVEVSRHPNIDLYTYSELINVERQKGEKNFTVDILKKSSFVDHDKCTGCGICMTKCPSKKIPSEFEDKLSNRTSIYIPFPQAVPRKAVIDADHCLYLANPEKNICRVCEKVCPSQAINYEMTDEVFTFNVASIIVATGYETIDLTQNPALQRYNYDRFKNVITAMQFERMMSASGPTEGHIIRLSDNKPVKRIGFILCVGSRSLDVCSYCSKICCMYSTKEAVVTKIHEPDVEVSVFYNDLRVIGKNQDEFMVRAEEEYGVDFIRGIPADIQEDPKTKNLIVRHADLISGDVHVKEFDLVVLSVAVTPNNDSKTLGEMLGIESDIWGWYETKNSLDQVSTNVNGIYIAGCCQSPDDIATCVAKSSAAAVKAGIHARLMTAAELKIKQPVHKEKYISTLDAPRVGVFVCKCGSNIAGFVDIDNIVDDIKEDPNVAYVMENMYTCSQDSQDIIKEKILEHDLNRVVVAACTPRTHESLFQETLQEAGLNPYLFNFVSIRELVSWVHMKDREKANDKALDLIHMGISRVLLQEPLYSIKQPSVQTAVVIGAGISGISAALEIADHGFHVTLIEKNAEIGGQLKTVGKFNFDFLDGTEILNNYHERLNSNKLIKIRKNTEIKEISGSIGKYRLLLESDGTQDSIESGVIIVATGAEEYKPLGLFGYDEDKRVQTQLELSVDIEKNRINEDETIIFIQCVGSRQKENKSYCSLICCGETLRHVLLLKEKYPKTNIYVLYRDVRVNFKEELSYWKAREKVNYIRFIEYPVVDIGEDNLFISVKDILTQANLRIKADRLVLATPLIPHEDNKHLSEMLKVPLDNNGFFLEAHPKLKPVDFATDGVFLCGTAHAPKGFSESISQGRAAASHALIPLKKGYIESEPIVAEVKPELCIGCQACEEVCAFGAIGVDVKNMKSISHVNPLLCKGCGTCAAVCPADAIVIKNFTRPEIEVMITESLKSRNHEPKIVTFLCNWCSYAGADTAGVSRFQYPTNIRPIRVMCSGRIDPNFVLQAFIQGADGVMIGGCHLGDCHYLEGNYHAQQQFNKLRRSVKEAGIDPRRIRLEWISASEGKQFAEIVTKFSNFIKNLNREHPILEVTK